MTGAEQLVSTGGLIQVPQYLAVGIDGTVYVTNGQLDASSADDVILAIDPTTGAQSVLVSGLGFGPLEVEADGSLLVRVAEDGTLRRVDPSTGAIEIVASGLAGAALALVLSAPEPGAALLAVAGVALVAGRRRRATR